MQIPKTLREWKTGFYQEETGRRWYHVNMSAADTLILLQYLANLKYTKVSEVNLSAFIFLQSVSCRFLFNRQNKHISFLHHSHTLKTDILGSKGPWVSSFKVVLINM